MIFRLIGILLIFFLCSGCEDEQTRIDLFDGYFYGMPYSDVKERSRAVECANDPANLCRPTPVSFFKEAWYQRFIFKEKRLLAVEIINLKPETIEPIINPWLDSGYRFIPVLIKSGGLQLDLFAAMRSAGKEGARRAVLEFNKATASDLQNEYLYFDLQDREHCLDAMNSYGAILHYGPRDLIGISETMNEKEFILSFHAPVAEWQDRGVPRPNKR